MQPREVCLQQGKCDPSVFLNANLGRFSRPLLEAYFQTSSRYEPKAKSLAVAEIFRYCKGFRLSYSYFCLFDQKYKRGVVRTLLTPDSCCIAGATWTTAKIEAIDEIPGIARRSAEVILAEIGLDMGRFPSAAHLCSWAGVCPGNYQSAGRRKHGKTTKGNKALKTILTQCAKSAKTVKSSYFFAQYQRISARRGKNRATLAVAHSMLIAIYHILKNKTAFHDLGSDYYDSFNRDRKINSYLKRLKALGWEPDAIPSSA